ncbi:hypothetical protein A9Q81_11950 [Gammaproteobacteria bacterium 42_54_T18]|nr:hypothetical protein A9Q81_11950 [Gammaproteobacteria bacterium 42_54_T18]
MDEKARDWKSLIFQTLVGGGVLAVVVAFALPKLFPDPVKITENISLNTDTAIGKKNADCILPKSITTNGYNLDILCDEVIASDTSIVTGFKKAKPANNNGKSKDGTKGTDGTGEKGVNGVDGISGVSGSDGNNSGRILIEANSLVGNLSINNLGQAGGDGGQGGSGGHGGKGGQGKAAKGVDCVNLVVGKVCNCKGGPGRGGKGGDGGDAGVGGAAGSGGDSGNISVNLGSTDGIITILARGGSEGKPGMPGTSGDKGQGGAEGVLHGCDSANRVGSSGIDGITSTKGAVGSLGKNGMIKLRIDGKEISESGGTVRYPSSI